MKHFPHVRSFSGLAFTFSLAVLGGCKNSPAPPPPPPPPKVTVVKPVQYEVQRHLEYNGYLDAVQTNDIRARVKGFLNEVHFKEGAEVDEKALLYTIDPRQYEANVAKSKADIAKAMADMANADAQSKLAEADYVRFKASGSGASKSELDKAEATFNSNKALFNVAKANKAAAEAALQSAELELEYTKILSPIAGRISRTLVTKGNLVGQNDATLLTTIVSVDPLYVYFDVPEKDLVGYQRAQQAQPIESMGTPKVPIKLGVATEEGYPHSGTLDFRENKVDTGTGTIRLRGTVPNPMPLPSKARLLYPGLFTRIQVPNGPSKKQFVIPEDALMTGQEGRYVYVIGENNSVVKCPVTVGANVWRMPKASAKADPATGWTLNNPNPPPPVPPGTPSAPPAPTSVVPRSIIAIEDGLKENDQVIILGLQRAQQVQPGQPVAPELWNLISPSKK